MTVLIHGSPRAASELDFSRDARAVDQGAQESIRCARRDRFTATKRRCIVRPWQPGRTKAAVVAVDLRSRSGSQARGPGGSGDEKNRERIPCRRVGPRNAFNRLEFCAVGGMGVHRRQVVASAVGRRSKTFRGRGGATRGACRHCGRSALVAENRPPRYQAGQCNVRDGNWKILFLVDLGLARHLAELRFNAWDGLRHAGLYVPRASAR